MSAFQRFVRSLRHMFASYSEIKRPTNVVDYTLLQRIEAARKRLPDDNVKPLRRRLEDAVAHGRKEEAKTLTRDIFRELGVI